MYYNFLIYIWSKLKVFYSLKNNNDTYLGMERVYVILPKSVQYQISIPAHMSTFDTNHRFQHKDRIHASAQNPQSSHICVQILRFNKKKRNMNPVHGHISSYTLYILAYINFLFNLRLLDVLFLYYYYSQILNKCKYYISCIFYIWLMSLTNQLELINKPS
jgi:hypothetical protein